MRTALAAWAWLAAALFVMPSAHADTQADAKDLFSRGRELRAKGSCATAVDLFRKSHELYPAGLGSLRNLAECEETLGAWASAARDWLDLKRATLVDADPKYAGWDADADAAVARIGARVPHLTITLAKVTAGGTAPLDPAEAAKLTVSVNGQRIDQRLIDTPLDRDPGRYEVRVEGGKEPVETTVTLEAAALRSVRLVVKLADDAAPAVVPVVSPEPPHRSEAPAQTDSGASTRAIGWASIGIGGASLAGAVVALALRQKAISDLESACPQYSSRPCEASARPAVASAVDHGRTASVLFDVFGIAGVVGVGLGVTLVLTNPPTSSDPAARPVARTRLRFAPFAGARGGGGALVGEF